MIYREIVHTCSNAYVADAAVVSIGGEIARCLADDAHRHAMSRGDYTAKLVRDFARHADDGDQRRVVDAALGSQQPVLSGLRYILEAVARPETAWMSGARI